jgi:uncharacterized membrane protein
MNNLVVSIFENDSQAEEARRYLLAKENEETIHLDDRKRPANHIFR